MVRVLQVVTKMGYGGLEAMIMNYYRHIDRNKIQFDFLVHRPEEADYHEEIRELGGKIYKIDRLNPFSISYRKALANFFGAHPEYKIIHVHQDCMSSIVLKVAKHCHVPYRIAHSHNSSQEKNIKYPIKMHYRKYIKKYATKMFACGYDAGKFMFGRSNFDILYNAIDTDMYEFNRKTHYRIRNELGIHKDELLIGHVGKFRLQKNHKFIVEIFEKILNLTNAKMILVGEGELMESIKQVVSDKSLKDKVIFLGTRSDIPELLQAMDLFLFPSLYEGLPVALIEAQASSLPCLISDQIPKECKKTDYICQLSLNASSQKWADKALTLSKMHRKSTKDEMIKSGYDITENAKKLQYYYSGLVKEEYNE